MALTSHGSSSILEPLETILSSECWQMFKKHGSKLMLKVLSGPSFGKKRIGIVNIAIIKNQNVPRVSLIPCWFLIWTKWWITDKPKSHAGFTLIMGHCAAAKLIERVEKNLWKSSEPAMNLGCRLGSLNNQIQIGARFMFRQRKVSSGAIKLECLAKICEGGFIVREIIAF